MEPSIGEDIMRRRNEARRYLDPFKRGRSCVIKTGKNESKEHADTKIIYCNWLLGMNKEFYVEAYFCKPYKGRPDIVVLDDFLIVEVLWTETLEELAQKTKTYPLGIFELETVQAQ